MKRKLTSTFSSDDLSQMTLVCIPASSIKDNEDRYSSFSERLCNALGMRNAFSHITITKEKTQSHLGGNDKAEYHIDGNFFNGKYIILKQKQQVVFAFFIKTIDKTPKMWYYNCAKLI